MIKEVTPEYLKSFSSLGLAEQPPKPGGHVLYPAPVISDHVIEIARIFVVPAGVEGESLQRHESARAADWHLPRGELAEYSLTAQRNYLPIQKGEPQAGNDEGGEVSLQVTQRSALVIWSARRNQEVDRNLGVG